MKVMITGGAGFIGSHLAEALLANGHDVYIIDDLSTGKIENIKHLQDDEQYRDRFFVYLASILHHKTILELVGICDFIFHLAAAVGVRYILDNPLASVKTNIQGTEKVLELCSRFKKKMLLASTSEVYGKHLHAPLVESDNLIYGPSSKFRWSYAASKLMDEFMALAYFRTNNLKVVVTRLFNTIGPRQTGVYGMVVPSFIEQALQHKPLTVYGNGQQTRTFTYIKDVVTALINLIQKNESFGEVFNIGGVEEISILALAEKIITMTRSKSKIEFIPYEQEFGCDFEDMMRRVPSIEKINRLIGFKPETDLNTMLQRVIDAFVLDKTINKV